MDNKWKIPYFLSTSWKKAMALYSYTAIPRRTRLNNLSLQDSERRAIKSKSFTPASCRRRACRWPPRLRLMRLENGCAKSSRGALHNFFSPPVEPFRKWLCPSLAKLPRYVVTEIRRELSRIAILWDGLVIRIGFEIVLYNYTFFRY